MRPHGKAQISARSPRALGVCQRCGFLYNLDGLQSQWDWQQGPRLKDLRFNVCDDCLDVPQESGRTIVLPPDPTPVPLALPEDYVSADNPLSTLGYSPSRRFTPTPANASGNIGNMTLNAGLDAPFDGNVNKRAEMSAALSISNSSFQNWVGKKWNADPSGITTLLPSTVAGIQHIASQVVITAPNDRKFLNSATGITGVNLDGSTDALTWTTLATGTTAGAIGEVVTITSTVATAYPYHRVAIQGDGVAAVAIAQAAFSVSDQVPNDI